MALVVPPLAHLSWPSLGVHLLQAIGQARGVDVRVVYLSAIYAQAIGSPMYAHLTNTPTHWLMGERLLAWKAWGLLTPETSFEGIPVDDGKITERPTAYLDPMLDATDHVFQPTDSGYYSDELTSAARLAGDAVETLADALVAAGYRVVGVTTSFDQTAAAVALIEAVKRRDPTIRTLIGGANCEGEMAVAVSKLSDHIDHVFAGEAEATFGAFLSDLAAGREPPRLLIGSPCENLDVLPRPDYRDYLDALRDHTPELLDSGLIWLSYETSRGCWWGEKQHCTFCGLNAMGLGFRVKSPDVVIADLKALVDSYPSRYVMMTDNILPHAYHRTVLPRIPSEVGAIHAFYEIKANLTLDHVVGLGKAGVKAIQPGIESLSSPVLQLMRKGVLARQNIALLRYAQVAGIIVKWNLLYAFPGDDAEDYAIVVAMLPFLHHLGPPHAAVHLSIDRYSPYFERPADHGITALRPMEAYAKVFPPHVDPAHLAYHFVGDWVSGSRDDIPVRNALWDGTVAWREKWVGEPPVCHIRPVGPGTWLLVDNRSGATRSEVLSDAQARAALVGGPWERVSAGDWAVQAGLALHLDDWCVPLATAPLEVLQAAEARWLKTDAPPPMMLGRAAPAR